jgi:hypothetical protein
MRRRILIPITFAILLLSACGSSETSSTPTGDGAGTSESEQAEVSGTPLDDFLAATTDRGTAEVSILILTTLGTEEAAVEGTGAIDFAQPATNITWSDELGDVNERRTPDGLFVQLDLPDGPWYQLETNDATPTSYSLDPLSGLASVTNATNEGSEVIDGIQTTRYVGTTDPADCIAGAGFNDEDQVQLEGSEGILCRVSMWVDEDNRIVRIDRLFTAEIDNGVTASSLRSTTLSNFGAAVSIETPQIVESAPEGQ